MATLNAPPQQSYESLYQDFDSPFMQQLRREAYGEDIGQHSWVTAPEVRGDIARLALTSKSRLLDLGCGPCGPLTYIMSSTGCSATGADLSAEALAAGQRRALALKVDSRLKLEVVDLDGPIPFERASFDGVLSLDVILHLRDRPGAFTEIARVLVPGGRVLFTDSCIVTGALSNEDVAMRSMHGFTQFTGAGHNERMLEEVGFRVLESEDRTPGMLSNASGRFKARLNHRSKLETMEGAERFQRYQAYLQSIMTMAERGAIARMMYLAETCER